MQVVFGFDFFGPVDRVPGLFYVTTRCFHVVYLPIVPLGSYVVLDETAEGIMGVRVQFSRKSYVYAWARALLGAIGVLGVSIGGTLFVSSPDLVTAALPAAGLAAFALMRVTRLAMKASRLRALELAQAAGIPRSALLRALEQPPPWPARAVRSPAALFEGFSMRSYLGVPRKPGDPTASQPHAVPAMTQPPSQPPPPANSADVSGPRSQKE